MRNGNAIAVIMSDKHQIEGERQLILVPTFQALYDLLYAVGFKDILIKIPPQQLAG